MNKKHYFTEADGNNLYKYNAGETLGKTFTNNSCYHSEFSTQRRIPMFVVPPHPNISRFLFYSVEGIIRIQVTYSYSEIHSKLSTS